MYFLVALGMTLISLCLLLFVKTKKNLHFGILTIIFGAATLMWLIDCIFSAAGGDPFLSFDDPMDGWIALATVLAGVFFWLVVSFVMNNCKKEAKQIYLDYKN